MATPQDKQRIRAFQAFVASRANPEACRIDLGISPRSWERMRSGRKPPPARLFPRFALIAWRNGLPQLAQDLWEAGMNERLRAFCAPFGGDFPTLDAATADRLEAVLIEQDRAEAEAIAALAAGGTDA